MPPRGAPPLPLQESKWLKKKLAENAYTFSEHLDASSRYIAAKAPKVMPTSGVARGSATLSAVRAAPLSALPSPNQAPSRISCAVTPCAAGRMPLIRV